jgi:ubiquinone/menaquinone biosynthesis C-methylase UbiE
LKPTDHILDIACGPGTVSLLAAPLVKRVTALDFSTEMIARLRERIAASGIENIETGQCDCQSLPIGDNQFDAVFSQFGLMFFPDRNRGFREAFRVLKPGGRISVCSWAPVAQSEAMTLMIDALRTGFSAHMPPTSDNRDIVRGLDDRTTFMNELHDAGFEAIEIAEVAHSFPVYEPHQFWDDMVSSSAPIMLMKSRLTEQEWLSGEKRAIELLMGRIEEKEKLYSTAYLACAQKPLP